MASRAQAGEEEPRNLVGAFAPVGTAAPLRRPEPSSSGGLSRNLSFRCGDSSRVAPYPGGNDAQATDRPGNAGEHGRWSERADSTAGQGQEGWAAAASLRPVVVVPPPSFV